jgi:hypothetical protein
MPGREDIEEDQDPALMGVPSIQSFLKVGLYVCYLTVLDKGLPHKEI